MIVRVVKLTFREEAVKDFITLFEEKKESIRNFSGCQRLELLGDKHVQNVFFTYSFWNTEEDLNAYRNSDLFKVTWASTKALFSDKPEAWSLEQKHVLT